MYTPVADAVCLCVLWQLYHQQHIGVDYMFRLDHETVVDATRCVIPIVISLSPTYVPSTHFER